MKKRDALALDQLLVVVVIGNDHDDFGRQVAGLMLPQQLQQRVLGARDEDPQAFPPRRAGQAPLHPEPAGDRLERHLQVLAADGQVGQAELDAHEEGAFAALGRVLVGMDDVGAVIE